MQIPPVFNNRQGQKKEAADRAAFTLPAPAGLSQYSIKASGFTREREGERGKGGMGGEMDICTEA
ncbi:hypothetical protein CLOM621_07226 [Clostridium sp. M62/1]|nr:hypothetical protein CLOM621_07226 [Clostridium sp. M62/1]